jgi:hypothetical protein
MPSMIYLSVDKVGIRKRCNLKRRRIKGEEWLLFEQEE